MIELCVEPVVGAVALLASGRELPGHMVRIGRTFEVGGVARIACRGHCLKLTVGCALVTRIAIHRSMGPRQWEAIVVLLDLLNRNLPSAHGMARLAIGA